MSDEKLKPDKNENRIKLTVITTEGNYTGEFNIHNHLQQVIDKITKELNLSINPSQYDLYLAGSTTVLNPSLTIEAVGLNDNSVLEYRIRNGGGGQGV